jgi:hypothetical protein
MPEPVSQPPKPLPPEQDVYGVVVPDDFRPADLRMLETVVPEIVREDDEPEPLDEPTPRFQFTVRDMLLLTTGVAIWLGVMSTVNWGWSIAAGVAGVAALISLIVLSVHEPENPTIRRGWWCVLGVYLLTCLAAMIAGR